MHTPLLAFVPSMTTFCLNRMFSIHGVSSLPLTMHMDDNQKPPSTELPSETLSTTDTTESVQHIPLNNAETRPDDHVSVHDPEFTKISEPLTDTDIMSDASSEGFQTIPASTSLLLNSKQHQEGDAIDKLPQSAKNGDLPNEGLSGFAGQIDSHKLEIEEQFQNFSQNLEKEPLTPDLEMLDWQELEDRYCREMESKIVREQDLMKEFELRFQQFMLWMQVSNEREAERATKRLRTRMAFVQSSEDSLAQKQNHYAQVVQAFQSAMNLLQQP